MPFWSSQLPEHSLIILNTTSRTTLDWHRRWLELAVHPTSNIQMTFFPFSPYKIWDFQVKKMCLCNYFEKEKLPFDWQNWFLVVPMMSCMLSLFERLQIEYWKMVFFGRELQWTGINIFIWQLITLFTTNGILKLYYLHIYWIILKI